VKRSGDLAFGGLRPAKLRRNGDLADLPIWGFARLYRLPSAGLRPGSLGPAMRRGEELEYGEQEKAEISQ
jgi:hypothetical protein